MGDLDDRLGDADKKVINQIDNSFKQVIRKSLYYINNEIYSLLQNNIVKGV